jgi:hypothetical protein
VNPTAPTITSFAASPATITAGGSASLTGVFANGTGVITPGNIAATSGTAVSVTPSDTTIYTLTVTNSAGVITQQTATVTVNPAAPTITSFAANPATITAGGTSSLTGVFANGTGVITPGNITATSGTAVSVTPTDTTIYTLTVTNSAGVIATQTATVTVNAALIAQTITFANPGAQTVGTPQTLSATATSGLAVSFASTTTNVCTVSGTTATFIAAGTCTITASQAGNSTYAAAAPVSQSFTVNAASLIAQTITFANPGAQTVGTPQTLSATATSGLAVSFASTTTNVCTVSGTTATFLTAGTCTITASQAGNSTYAAATPVSQSFAVNGGSGTLKPQTIDFPAIPTQTIWAPMSFYATASSGLPVTFTILTPSICGDDGQYSAIGTCTVEATQAGNSTYAAATPVTQNITVVGATQAIDFGPIAAQTVRAHLTLSATASSGLPVSFASTTPTICSVTGTTATMNAAGSCSIQATQAGGPEGYTTYGAATPIVQSFTVYGTTQTISFTPPAGTYSSAQTVTINDSVTGASIYYTTDGSTPTTASTPYTGAITVSSTETLSAMAPATATAAPAMASALYTISTDNIVVSVSPTTASLNAGATQSFTATVTGATGSASTSVTWNATCGSLSSTTANPVTYTAPALAENCIVTAISVADTTKSGQATVTVATPGTVNIVVTPASSTIPINGQIQITATVTGSSNTAVTWTSNASDCGTLSNTSATTVTYVPAPPAALYNYPTCEGGSTGNVSGSFMITATSVANPADSATAVVLVDPGTGGNYPDVPYPVAAHPRIWITPTDVTRLQGWAVNSNPIYSQGTLPILQGTITVYNTAFFPGGQPNTNWPDPGDTQGYACNSSYTYIIGTSCLTEENALVFAFNSLIDPSPANRITYAQYARNLIMYAMNQAVLGLSPELPFRDPAYATYNHASATMQDWPLVVDWIYNTKDANGNDILTAADKATIRNVFLIWAAQEVNVADDVAAPSPEGVVNSLQLLPNNLPFRMAANNYYLAHGRNITMMALAIDPNDDPPVDPSQPASQLGNSLRSYILEGTGAFLYQAYAMFGDPQTVATAYGIPGNGAGFGLTSGGLPAEGMLYGESYGYLLGQLLALQTAGFNDPTYAGFTGPQISLIGAPIWDRYVKGMISSLIPTSFVPSAQTGDTYLGAVYEYASYGDMFRFWVTPDNISSFSLLSLLENEQGQTTHQADSRWFVTNVLPGGASNITARVVASESWGIVESIEYFLLFDPNAAANPDPRPTFPLLYYDPGMARIVAHSDWNSANTMFDYRASWESIYHQQGSTGEFELFRKGEWLTTQMTNYDGLGSTSPYHNTLTLKNTCANGTPSNLQWFETSEWANGSQFGLDNAGDPTTLMSSGTGYVYAVTDMTNLYNRPVPWGPSDNAMDITRAQRNIFWINNDFIVTYDRATSQSSGLFKQYNLSLIGQPAISGQNATETMADGQQLYIHTLLPQDASITSVLVANCTTVPPCITTADLEPAQYVMTVQDASNPTDTRFLHVLEGVDAGGTPLAVSSITSSNGTAFDGAVVGTTALMFIHDDTQTAGFTSTAYSEPSTVTANYVAGLTPNAGYTVTKSAAAGTIQVTVAAGGSKTADAAGVLAF